MITKLEQKNLFEMDRIQEVKNKIESLNQILEDKKISALELLSIECKLKRLNHNISHDLKKSLNRTTRKLHLLYEQFGDGWSQMGKLRLIIQGFQSKRDRGNLNIMPQLSKWLKVSNRSISIFHGKRPKEFATLDLYLKVVEKQVKKINYKKYSDINNEILNLHTALVRVFDEIIGLLQNPMVKEKRDYALWNLLEEVALAIGYTIEQSDDLKDRYILDMLLNKNEVTGRFEFLLMKGKLKEFYENAFLTPKRQNCPDQLMKIPGFDENCHISLIGNKNNATYLLTYKSILSGKHSQCIFRQISRDKENAKAIQKLKENSLDSFIVPSLFNCKSGFKGDDSFLEVVKYLKSGNLQNIIDKGNHSVHQRQKMALKYLKHLCHMIYEFNKCGVFFPDLKPSNLMLKNSQFILSDLKSLIPFDTETRLASSAVMSTRIYWPPEQSKHHNDQSNRTIDVDLYSSYQVGLTIYLFAVGLKGDEGPYKISPSEKTGQRRLDFSHPVFEGKRGDCLKKIIKGLTELSKSKRIKLNEAIVLLNNTFPTIEKENFKALPVRHEKLKAETRTPR
ncbi:protein kinase domain-containing protein [Legionella sainthelensi]|nr:serine/threonine-protein kinase [Legionella sainthelensi]